MVKLESNRVVGHIISKGKEGYVLRICLYEHGHCMLDSTPMEYSQVRAMAEKILKPQDCIEETNREKNWDLHLYDEKTFKHLHWRGDIG